MTLLSTAPTICSFTWPSLMTSSVGIPRILKRAAVEPFASTSSLPTLTRPLYSTAMESMVGASARHGAHHAAQKSTSTGVVDFTTSDSKLESVISTVFSPMNPPKNFTVAGRNRKSQIGDTRGYGKRIGHKKAKKTQEIHESETLCEFCAFLWLFPQLRQRRRSSPPDPAPDGRRRAPGPPREAASPFFGSMAAVAAV